MPVWETTLNESIDKEQVNLPLSANGRHTILVTGDKTAGDFALSWTVK